LTPAFINAAPLVTVFRLRRRGHTQHLLDEAVWKALDLTSAWISRPDRNTTADCSPVSLQMRARISWNWTSGSRVVSKMTLPL